MGFFNAEGQRGGGFFNRVERVERVEFRVRSLEFRVASLELNHGMHVKGFSVSGGLKEEEDCSQMAEICIGGNCGNCEQSHMYARVHAFRFFMV